jgi:hypothetical protein
MTSFHQRLTELIDSYKETEGTTISITIEKATDPTKRPGNWWKSAISVQVATQFAQKEILILVGPTTNGYYYR